MDAAVTAVLLKLDAIFTVEEEQVTALKAFLGRKDVSALVLTRFVSGDSGPEAARPPQNVHGIFETLTPQPPPAN